MRTLRRILGDLSYRYFHNKVRPDINLLYRAYHLLAKLRFVGKRYIIEESTRHAASSLKQMGFYVFRAGLSLDRINQIAIETRNLFETEHPNVKKPTPAIPITAVSKALQLCPFIEELLDPQLIAIAQAFFNSEAHLLRTELYRLHPSTADLGDSWLWHFDNVPSQIIKAMIYLTDTSIATGALSLIPRAKSFELQQRGFWDRNKITAFQGEVNEGRNKVVVEGPAGTIVLFSGHYCIHKATPPQHDYRDAVIFTFQPSIKPLYARLNESRLNADLTWAYQSNPFTGRARTVLE